MSKNNVKPEIRFKNFTDAWEQRKLGENSQILAGGTPKTKIKEYWEPKEIPWMSSGEINKKRLRETDNKISQIGYDNSNARWVKNNSVLIALAGQGKTRGTVAINEIPLTTNQSIAAIEPNNKLISEFLFHNLDRRYEELRLVSSGAGTRGGLNKKLISEIEIMTPSIHEQIQVGQFFKKLDNTIALHQHELTLLKQRKKAFLQKMFPKKGERNPELRLLNLDEEWRLQSIGHCFEERNERSSKGELLSVTINSGVVKASSLDRKDSSSNNKSNYKVVNEGDIAYNSMRMWQGASGLSLYNGIVSPAYTILVPKEKIDSHFFSYYFKLYYMIKTFQSNSQGLTSDTWNLKYPLIKKIPLSIPSYDEQIEISKFFKKIDEDIELHVQKLEKLKQMKKAFLQKMFV